MYISQSFSQSQALDIVVRVDCMSWRLVACAFHRCRFTSLAVNLLYTTPLERASSSYAGREFCQADSAPGRPIDAENCLPHFFPKHLTDRSSSHLVSSITSWPRALGDSKKRAMVLGIRFIGAYVDSPVRTYGGRGEQDSSTDLVDENAR